MAEFGLLQKDGAFADPWAGQLLDYFLPQRCSEAIFLRHHFLDGPCLRTALSKVAGGLVILGSTTVKLPQMAKILGAQNAEGVSLASVLGELVAVTGSLAYGFANGFPFSAWGEALFVTLQTVGVGFLVQHYGGRTRAGVCFLLLYSAALATLLSPLAPAWLLSAIQASNVPAVVVSRLVQAAVNLGNGHTGQLSALTVGALFAGSLVRIFTSVQETGDALLVFTYVVSVLCNGLIAAQVLYYWKSTQRFLRGGGKRQRLRQEKAGPAVDVMEEN
ncbi:mannose-P-dolichol utilization defect 1 protein-like isoform X2 [Stigmatopora nigra]